MEINRKRLKYKAEHPEDFDEDFLGKNACTSCSDEPRHQDPDECPVEYFRKYGKMPKQCSLPCHYCDSFDHITDACEFLHKRCVLCKYRGHMAFECRERNTEEWLVAYLNCVHLGKWTRRNSDGPIRGRFGFGDTSDVALTPSTKTMISAKRNSLRFARHKESAGQPSCDSSRDIAASWEQLRKQEIELTQRIKDFEKEKQSIYRQLDKLGMELRQLRKRRAIATKIAATQTGSSGDRCVMSQPRDEQISPDKVRDVGDKDGKDPEPKKDGEDMEDDMLELHVKEYFV